MRGKGRGAARQGRQRRLLPHAPPPARPQIVYASFFTGGGLGLLVCPGCGPGGGHTWSETSRLIQVSKGGASAGRLLLTAARAPAAVADAPLPPGCRSRWTGRSGRPSTSKSSTSTPTGGSTWCVGRWGARGSRRAPLPPLPRPLPPRAQLVTNHVDNDTLSGVYGYEAPPFPAPLTDAGAWTKHALSVGAYHVLEPGPNQASPGSAQVGEGSVGIPSLAPAAALQPPPPPPPRAP